jgi:hypothetical protein
LLLKNDFSQIGMSDGFGTIHWAPRRELRMAQEKYRNDFPLVSQPNAAIRPRLRVAA